MNNTSKGILKRRDLRGLEFCFDTTKVKLLVGNGCEVRFLWEVLSKQPIRCLRLSGTASPEVYQLLKKSISSPNDSIQFKAIDALKILSPGFGPQVKETVSILLAIPV